MSRAPPRYRSLVPPPTTIRGFTLVEVLVALILLAIAGSLSIRLLERAAREMEGAEVGLRAALLLSEWSEEGDRAAIPVERSAGPGRLVAERSPDGASVRFEPPEVAEELAPAIPGIVGSGGFLEEREWRLTKP